MTDIVEKRPVGRPSSYKEEYADELIRFFDQSVYSIIEKVDEKGKIGRAHV